MQIIPKYISDISSSELEPVFDLSRYNTGHWLSEVGKERMILQKGKPVAALSAAFQLLA